ncbi:MAG TPA: hypothetical protein VEA78_02010, partial [Acidimicrobiales bacterium]|nr:hypothetical protein [Acidimicrobiales bacterium]
GMGEHSPTLRLIAEEAGRDPDSIRITPSIFAAPDASRRERFESLGVERLVCYLPPAGRDVVLPILDDYASAAAQ